MLAARAKEHTQLLIAFPAFRAKGQEEAAPTTSPSNEPAGSTLLTCQPQPLAAEH